MVHTFAVVAKTSVPDPKPKPFSPAFLLRVVLLCYIAFTIHADVILIKYEVYLFPTWTLGYSSTTEKILPPFNILQ